MVLSTLVYIFSESFKILPFIFKSLIDLELSLVCHLSIFVGGIPLFQ